MMKGSVSSAVAAVMQESFGCAVANRFYQLLDDESDPFDILREAERRRQQRKERDEAAAGGRAGRGGRAGGGGGKRESQKERRQLGSPTAGPPQPGVLRCGCQQKAKEPVQANSRISSVDEKVLKRELVVISNLPGVWKN